MNDPQSRYLVLTELFLPTKGGTAVWFSEVYRRLGGKTIHIVTRDVPGAAEIDAHHPNRIHRLRLERSPWLRPESLAIYLHLFLKSLSLAATHRFTSIHAGRALPEGLVAWLVARLTGRRVLVYAHGEELTGWGRGYKYRAMRFTLRHADRVIANSDHTRKELLRMGVQDECIVLINPGVDIQRYRPELPYEDLRTQLRLSSDQPFILSVGRLQRRKGFDMVIRSLPELLAKGLDVHYAIIGIGEDRDYLTSLANEIGMSERVHLLGHVAYDALPRWYNACDLLTMPNREIDGDTEGFGMVFIEAAACGKPSIAGRAGGTGSAVQDGVTGLRVDGTNPSAVSDALASLLQDRQRCRQLGERALIRAQTQFAWKRVAEQTHSIEQAIVNT